MTTRNLTERSAIATDPARVIGLVYARSLAEAGVSLALFDRVSAENVARSLRADGSTWSASRSTSLRAPHDSAFITAQSS
jgi:hypothetical protein